MKGNFDACLAETLKHEGGWADDPQDPGGATMQGVTIGTFRAFKGRSVTKAELRAISPADLRAIYRRGYWDKVRADDLPAGVDLVAFDAAVNSGPDRGAKWLQGAVGAKQDGKIGPATIRAAHDTPAAVAIGLACDRRMAFLRGLSHWPRFGKGWAGRVSSVRLRALAMASQTPASSPPHPAPQLPPATAPAVDPIRAWVAPAAILAVFAAVILFAILS